MNAFERYFHGSFGASRAHLLSRAFLLLVALDAWTIMLGHSAKYGFLGFNTAHFGWLDALIPGDNRNLYQAVLLGCGSFAMLATLLGGRRPLVIGAFVLHALSWSMSMLDSYQHHYFTSLVLLCMAVWPQTTAASVHPPAMGELVPAAGSKPPVVKRPKRGKHKARRSATGPARDAEPTKPASPPYMTPVYAAVIAGVALALALTDFSEHGPIAGVIIGGFAGVATWVYQRPATSEPTFARGFGFPLLATTIGIMYTYTALAKLDWNWLEGHTIQTLSGSSSAMAPLLAAAGAFGLTQEQTWSAIAVTTIGVELAIAVGYLLAPVQDRGVHRWLRAYLWFAWALAMALHIGIESIELRIGWFSFYMLALGCGYLLPLSVVDKLVTALTWPAQTASKRLSPKPEPAQSAGSWLALLGGLATVALIGVVCEIVDFPGARPFGFTAMVGVAGVATWNTIRGQRSRLPGMFTAVGITALLLLIAVTSSSTRFDFYRRLGKDYSRQREIELAIEAYEKADNYAPAGESRRKAIRKLEKYREKHPVP